MKAVGVYVEKEGKVLMIKEIKGLGKGLWCIPLGHVDEEESLESAAAREAKEETGYEIEIVRKIKNIIISGTEFKGRQREIDKEIEVNFFFGKIVGGELTIDKKEVDDVQWVDKKDVLHLPLRGEWLRFLFL